MEPTHSFRMNAAPSRSILLWSSQFVPKSKRTGKLEVQDADFPCGFPRASMRGHFGRRVIVHCPSHFQAAHPSSLGEC